jgi:hypothetical protein
MSIEACRRRLATDGGAARDATEAVRGGGRSPGRMRRDESCEVVDDEDREIGRKTRPEKGVAGFGRAIGDPFANHVSVADGQHAYRIKLRALPKHRAPTDRRPVSPTTAPCGPGIPPNLLPGRRFLCQSSHRPPCRRRWA